VESQSAQNEWFKRQAKALYLTGFAESQKKLAAMPTNEDAARLMAGKEYAWLRDDWKRTLAELEKKFEMLLASGDEAQVAQLLDAVKRLVTA
jgi:hypothetical protein